MKRGAVETASVPSFSVIDVPMVHIADAGEGQRVVVGNPVGIVRPELGTAVGIVYIVLRVEEVSSEIAWRESSVSIVIGGIYLFPEEDVKGVVGLGVDVVGAMDRAVRGAGLQFFVPEHVDRVVEFAKVVGRTVFLIVFKYVLFIIWIINPSRGRGLNIWIGEGPAGLAGRAAIGGCFAVDDSTGRLMAVSTGVGVVVVGISDCLDLLVLIGDSEGNVGLTLDAVVVGQVDEGGVVGVVVVGADHTSMHRFFAAHAVLLQVLHLVK